MSDLADNVSVGKAQVSLAVTAEEIDYVEVEVSAPDIDPPIVAPLALVEDAGEWKATGFVFNIPAGTARTFTISAYSGGEMVGLGEGVADIIADQTVAVTIVIQMFADEEDLGDALINGELNFQPQIGSVYANPSEIVACGMVNVGVTATDQNPTDVLSYHWTASGGDFDYSNTANTIWTAPGTMGTYELMITVTDDNGGAASFSFDIEVTTDGVCEESALAAHVGGAYAGLAKKDGYIFTGRGSTLEVYTDAGPSLSLAASMELSGQVLDLFVDGNYLYAVTYVGQLAVIDVTDPAHPLGPYEVDLGVSAYDMYITGGYAYVASLEDGLAIVDLSTPTAPAVVADVAVTSQAGGVYVEGGYAFVAAFDAGLAIIDVSDPLNPQAPAYYPMSNGYSIDVTLSGGIAYVGNSNGLDVVAVTDPLTPGTPIRVSTGSIGMDTKVAGSYAYVADAITGLVVLNVTDPLAPVVETSVDNPGGANDVLLSGNYAYLADTFEGLLVYDITDPLAPSLAYQIDTLSSRIDNIDLAGDYLYVPESVYLSANPAPGDGLAIINVSDPENPSIEAILDTPGEAIDVQVVGNYAFVSDGYAGLTIVDVADPANNPSVVTSVNLDNKLAMDLYVSGGYAYIRRWYDSMVAVDVSDPLNPGDPIDLGIGGDALDFVVDNGILYAPIGPTDSLLVVDVSDPYNLGTQYSVDLDGFPNGVLLMGTTALVSCGEAGIMAVDVSDPSIGMPILLTLDTEGSVNDVALVGSNLIVADGALGVVIFDVSDPGNIPEPTYLDTGGVATEVIVDGGYVYVADNSNGIVILELPVLP